MKVNDLRHFLLKSKCDDDMSASTIHNIDLAALPPTEACLKEHIQRTNYQVRIWKTAHIGITELPKPWDGHGWMENGEPCWCDSDAILLKTLVDILDTNHEELNDDNTDDDIDLICRELTGNSFADDVEEDDDDDCE